MRRELLYRLHPWFGRNAFVHGATERTNGVFRCTLDGSDIARSLGIPSWMFDCAACVSDVCIEAKPFVDCGSARRIVRVARPGVEDQLAIIECPALGRIKSRNRNSGESHGAEDDGISDRGPEQILSRIPTDGFVCKLGRRGRAKLVRPARGRAADAARPDDAAN